MADKATEVVLLLATRLSHTFSSVSWLPSRPLSAADLGEAVPSPRLLPGPREIMRCGRRSG